MLPMNNNKYVRHPTSVVSNIKYFKCFNEYIYFEEFSRSYSGQRHQVRPPSAQWRGFTPGIPTLGIPTCGVPTYGIPTVRIPDSRDSVRNQRNPDIRSPETTESRLLVSSYFTDWVLVSYNH